jgi:hypothetical protein
VARLAAASLRLPGATIVLSPPGRQLVGLPVWLTVTPGSWTPVSATASVAGVSVTATAAPVRARWSSGDGGSVVCAGPGTRWRPGTDPAAASPDCGYRWQRASARAPGGTYLVTAVVAWRVDWAGAGQSGTVAGLVTTGAVRVAVAESHALIEPPGAAVP